jgi:hypothetical protein
MYTVIIQKASGTNRSPLFGGYQTGAQSQCPKVPPMPAGKRSFCALAQQ